MSERISPAHKTGFTAFKAALACALLLFSHPVFAAACTTPTGNAGDIVYGTNNVMAYCNGTTWVAMGGGGVSFGTLTSGDFCLATSSTQISCTTATVNMATQVTGVLSSANGGTGINNGINTITLGSSLVTSGAFGLTLTTVGTTSVTLPTSGTLIAGTGTTNYVPLWTSATALGSSVIAQSGSNIGIGTASPLAPLHLYTGSNSVSTTAGLRLDGSAGIGGAIVPANNELYFVSSAGNQVLRIADGKIRLGGDSANVANIELSGGSISNQGNGGGLSFDNSANASLSAKLTVAGNIDATGTNGYVTEIANAGTTGTTVNKLAKLNTSGAAVIAATTDTDGMVGVVVGGAGTTGSAQLAIEGQVSCVFDGATTAGHFVTISTTTAGDCKDAGATRPSGSQTIGRVLTTNVSGGTYVLALGINGAGGGVPAGSSGQVQFNSGSSTFNADASLNWDNTNKMLYVGTIAGTPVGTTGTVAGVTVNVIPQAVSVTGGVSSGGTSITGGTTGYMAYYSGANAISGTSNLRVSGSNIGIGTGTANAPLHINGASFNPTTPTYAFNQIEAGSINVTGFGANGIALSNAATGTGYSLIGAQGDTLYFGHASGTTGSVLMSVTAAGAVTTASWLGVATMPTAPAYPLDVNAGTSYPAARITGTSAGTHLRLENTVSGSPYGVGVEMASSGGVEYFIGDYGSGSGYVNNFTIADTTRGALRAYIQDGVNGWQTPSDIRLKKDIQTLSVLDKIGEMRGVSYKLKDSGVPQIGVIAQETQKGFPDAVTATGKDKDAFLAVSYNAIAAIALQGVKELKALFDKEDERVGKLEAANQNQAKTLADQAKAIEELRQQFEAYKKAHP